MCHWWAAVWIIAIYLIDEIFMRKVKFKCLLPPNSRRMIPCSIVLSQQARGPRGCSIGSQLSYGITCWRSYLRQGSEGECATLVR